MAYPDARIAFIRLHVAPRMRIEGRSADLRAIRNINRRAQHVRDELLLQAKLDAFDPDLSSAGKAGGIVGEALAILLAETNCVLVGVVLAAGEALSKADGVPRARGHAVAAARVVTRGADVLRRRRRSGAVAARPAGVANAGEVEQGRTVAVSRATEETCLGLRAGRDALQVVLQAEASWRPCRDEQEDDHARHGGWQMEKAVRYRGASDHWLEPKWP
mmetsp:Transcript_81873/g.250191  ORF Transcript_81873/g.250191 Transcript_81873/m.250191 type:complete len:218 (-) Transcript_81873:7-660(-)